LTIVPRCDLLQHYKSTTNPQQIHLVEFGFKSYYVGFLENYFYRWFHHIFLHKAIRQLLLTHLFCVLHSGRAICNW